ncbi:MetQ/NlpA family ABC transporter substrate-binding protein [Aeromonas caviae]|uniref:MetQ/NlpA family ABC transporter substrate-binding protein n=2 Tax=Aeromonas caviae TaxID=648 RepID=UPI002B473E44|nr:MetQ/NlpA family ABC transporter substrate-binding protein [Aeromonas caviae]
MIPAFVNFGISKGYLVLCAPCVDPVISGASSFINKETAMLKTIFKLTPLVAAIMSGYASAGETIRLGIMSGEDEDVWKVASVQAKKQGLDIELIKFNDYILPNEALENGEIDANAFQHKPYLDNQVKSRGYHIVPVGNTAVWPIGLYSKKFNAVGDLPEGAIIGVPNDPSNEGRALRVLASAGVIKLRPGSGILATTTDIIDNPKKLQIRELDTGIIGRSLEDLDAAVVNTDWALKSGLSQQQRIYSETAKENPYNNFIAVKSGNESAPWVKTLVASYQNEQVKAALEKYYKGTAIPAW